MNTRKLCLMALLCAVAVVGSLLSFPVFGSKCAPVQHVVNVVSAITLGPAYGLAVAFLASLLRNILGIGSLLAFPGSMLGAFVSAVCYKKSGKLSLAVVGEIFGTGILGGLAAYPIAIAFMGQNAGEIAFYIYIVPFLISTTVGAIIGAFVVGALGKSGALRAVS